MPDAIVLNIAEEEHIPEVLDKVIREHPIIRVNRVKDTKVWKKFLPTFQLYPNEVIICIDDDFIYPSFMIQEFMEAYEANPACPVSGNKVEWYGLKCHCGCASLVKREFFDGIEVTQEMMDNCFSSDFAYTWLLAQKGIFYNRTKHRFFKNMPSLRHKDAWTNDRLRQTAVPNTLQWLEEHCEVKLDVHKIQPEVKVWYNVPYNSKKNIGKAYNDFAALVPDDAWICFMDADTMPTTPDYGTQIEEIIKENPKVKAFTCYTNRVGCPWQIAPGSDWKNDDMRYHRQLGAEMQKKHRTEVEDMSTQKHLLSGQFICVHKSVWKKIGGVAEKGMLGVDNDFHRRLRLHGIHLYIAKGLYVYHWYRGGDKTDTSHLV